MPNPQPAWAQQYDVNMHPAWGRKFEPPGVCGRESQDVIRTLLLLYCETGLDKYLEPIPKALDYLNASIQENDGTWHDRDGDQVIPIDEEQTVSVYRGGDNPLESVVSSGTFAANVRLLSQYLGSN